MRERDGAKRWKGREGGKRGREGRGIGKDRQTDKGGEMQWDAPVLFHLELALERIRLMALNLGLPAPPAGMFKVPFSQVEPDGGPEPACV